jgi:hypothetical protein
MGTTFTLTKATTPFPPEADCDAAGATTDATTVAATITLSAPKAPDPRIECNKDLIILALQIDPCGVPYDVRGKRFSRWTACGYRRAHTTPVL